MLLRNLHIAAAIIHLTSAVLSWVVHVDMHSDIILPKHVYSADPVKTVTSYEPWIKTNAMVWISVNELITMFSHVVAIIYLMMHNNSKEFENPRRTVEYSITAALLQCALLLGAGAVPAQDIIYIIISNVALQLLSIAMENNTNRNWLLGIGFLLLFSQMQMILFNSLRIEGISLDYFILMGVFYVLFYVAFGLLKILRIRDEDEIYVLMSVTSKVVLSWILIGNIFEGFKELGATTDPDYTDLDWRAIQLTITILGSVGLVLGSYLIVNRKVEYVPVSDSSIVMTRGGGFKNLRY
tara:strand:+ start:2481 stop:3368 length:888 start_codon:yes stop_codon:yes gene_type:complete